MNRTLVAKSAFYQQACYLKNDQRACSLAQGLSAGKTWHLGGEHESRVQDAASSGVAFRVIVHDIQCQSAADGLGINVYSVFNSPRDQKALSQPANERTTLKEPATPI